MAFLKEIPQAELLTTIRTESPPDAAWVFDCDGTLINGDICEETAICLLQHGLGNMNSIPPALQKLTASPFTEKKFDHLIQEMEKAIPKFDLHEWEAYLQAGLPPKMVADVAGMALDLGLREGRMHYTHPLCELAREMCARSWIVSGSTQPCVWAVADRVGISRERVLSTALETVDGICAPRLAPPGLVWEGVKRLILDENCVTQPWFVAGDTIGDWQMMEMATNWSWFVVWDKWRYRGEHTRKFAQENLLGPEHPLPEKPGTYLFHPEDPAAPHKKWVLEVKGGNK